jgi:hypothetical protein
VLRNLRSLYGKSSNGSRNRRDIKLSLRPETVKLLEMHLELGKGRYASPFVEMSIRTVIALMTDGEDIEQVANEIKYVIESPYLARNLRRLAKLIEE